MVFELGLMMGGDIAVKFMGYVNRLALRCVVKGAHAVIHKVSRGQGESSIVLRAMNSSLILWDLITEIKSFK